MIANARNYFRNSKPSTCPLTECKLMNEDCQSYYLGKYFKFYPGPDFNIFAANNINSKIKICIECFNGFQKMTSEVIEIIPHAFIDGFPEKIYLTVNEIREVKISDEVKSILIEPKYESKNFNLNQNRSQVEITFEKTGVFYVKLTFNHS